MYCDHVEHDGESLFRLACGNDLEGIVAKRKFDPYLPDKAGWLKIRNPNYSQREGPEDLFGVSSVFRPYNCVFGNFEECFMPSSNFFCVLGPSTYSGFITALL